MQQANHLIHEKVYQHIEQMKDKHNKPLFFEIPLLFETNKAWLFDEIWFIEVSEDIRLERLINQRNMTQEEISEREQFHMKPILKKFMSDVIIDNELSISKLYQQIDENLERIHHDTK